MTHRVLHLVGSAVSEFHCDLSRLYARDCLDATADPERYEFHIASVAPDGRWCFPVDLDDSTIAAADTMTLADAVAHIVSLDVDVMVPQMFCVPGMTHYRALFDTLALPYVGNPPDVMALTADKAKARAVVADAGVRVPVGEVVRPGRTPTLEPPVVVKPVDSDNSLGIGLVLEMDEYPGALDAAWAHSDRVLVERYVELGREVRCATIVRDGGLIALPLEEYAMDTRDKPVRDAADKLARGPDGEMRLVAKEATRAWIVDSNDPVNVAVHDAARRCHVALGCRDYGLFDFRIDPDGVPWFLEAGLYCSFARQSVIPVMAAAADIDLIDLFADSIGHALARAGGAQGGDVQGGDVR